MVITTITATATTIRTRVMTIIIPGGDDEPHGKIFQILDHDDDNNDDVASLLL